MMTPPHRDPRQRSMVLPTRCLWSDGAVSGTDVLLSARIARPTYPPPPTCIIPPGGAVLLDFGRELHGSVRLVTGAPKNTSPTPLRIRFGESASEAMGSPNNDHAMHDLSLAAPWCGEIEIGLTGFRFVRIDVPPDGSPLHLVAVHAVSLMRDIPLQGNFHCSNDLLDRIWTVGARTVHLCMQDVIIDGPKRDRLAWMGDTIVEARVIRAAFGTDPLIPQTLDHLRDTTSPDRDMNTIATYSMWWVIAVRDWFGWTGDRVWLTQQHPYLHALLHRLAGSVIARPGWRDRPASFVDHPSLVDADSSCFGTRAIEAMMFAAGADLCDWLGDNRTAMRCRSAVNLLRADPPSLHTLNKAATALLVLAGLLNPTEANRDVLAHDPCRGLSSFMGAFILDTRAIAGDYSGCIDLIEQHWGGMLAAGATSFWEDFSIDWLNNHSRIDELPGPGRVDIHADRGDFCYKGLRHSLCHGWSAGPTAWLTRHILGVIPSIDHPLHITLDPHLADLDFVEGDYPTPRGVLHVRHERRADQTIHSSFIAPPDIQVSARYDVTGANRIQTAERCANAGRASPSRHRHTG